MASRCIFLEGTPPRWIRNWGLCAFLIKYFSLQEKFLEIKKLITLRQGEKKPGKKGAGNSL